MTLTSASAPSLAVKTADELAPPTPEIDQAAAQRAYDDDRAHVFHSWSAQGALKPMVVAAAQGSWVWDGDGNRYLDFSSPAGQHQHRPPAPEGRRGDPGAGRPAVHRRAAARQRRRAARRPG